MKKLTALILIFAIVLGTIAAYADPSVIDGLSPRDILIHKAGLNPSADEMIAQGISPTTGRTLKDIVCPEGFAGAAVTQVYQPVMMQISNTDNGIGVLKDGTQYVIAPVNGSWADVVYESAIRKGGGTTRMSMIFSDTIPDYAGFARSTRATHARIRQEWDCAFCTSGYSSADVPKEWRALGVKDPTAGTAENPGIIYVGDVGTNKPWKKYVRRLKDQKGPDNELFELVKILNDIVPADHVPANHTWRFTDELPSGDSANIIYVSFGNQYDTDSRLEYDAETNAYIRYVKTENGPDLPYRDSTLVGAESVDERVNGKLTQRVVAEERRTGDLITFSNIIIQGITQNWKGADRPNPVLTGTGNADYFMGGKHIAGVWEREDYNSRTVFYGPDGEEIELQRGRTLIILMGYNNKGSSVCFE